MPAVPVALAEVERRVADIRRRLNRQTLIEALCPGIGAVLFLVAVVIAFALRSSAQTFQLVAYGAALLLVLITAAIALQLRRSLVSLDVAARVADSRAGMQERLTTTLWLKRSGRSSPLAALLVSDTFDRSSNWHPQAVAPRRLPRSAALPIAGAIALAAAIFLTPPAPPPAAPPPLLAQLQRKESPPLVPGAVHKNMPVSGVPDPQQRTHPRNSGERLAGASDSAETKKGEGRGAGKEGSDSRQLDRQGSDEEPDQRDTASGAGRDDSLPANLQHMIRQALGTEQADPKGARSSEAVKTKTEDSSAGGDRPSTRQKPGRAEDHRLAQNKDGGGQRLTKPGESGPQDTRSGKQSAQPSGQKAERMDPNKAGQSGKSGSGSSPETLFAAKPDGAGDSPAKDAAQAQPSASFKLTLSSFLPSSESRERKGGGRLKGTANTAQPVALAPLNPNQAADDAVRRADIPPEYEDIVRRLYARQGE